MKTKKLLSILLALMMMLSVVPFYASAAEKLTATANVESYPTLSYKTADGKMYYGQTLEEALIINDDEVVRDAAGNQVAGHFEFRKPEYIPTPGTDIKLDIIFVPDDEDAYTSFTKLRSSLVYTVEAVILVPVDENDPVPVASEVEPGALLSTSILSGGVLTNPHNPNEPNLLATEWIWSPSLNPASKTVVSSSGYYTAQFAPAGYDVITVQVYVKVASAIPETSIVEYPTVPELTYNPNVTWADIELTGGKAVIKGTDTQIEGTFTIKDNRLTGTPNPNNTQIEVVFTPANAEEALPYEFTIPVKVNPAPISFKGNDGNFIVDGFEFEVEPGTLMRDVQSYLMDYLNYPPQSVIGVEDKNSYAENGRTYKLTVQHDNPNYVGTEVSFTVKFKEVEFTPTFKSGYLNSAIDCGDYSPAGTFTVSLDGKEIAVVKENEQFTYTVENSGDYVLSAKYNPVENDYFVIADATKTVNVKLQRTVNRINCTSNGGLIVTYGDTVEISANANAENFDRWVITDASGNEVDLGIDLTQLNISFTMPDYDITVEAKAKSGSGTTDGGFDIDNIFGNLGDLTEGDSDNIFENIINNLVAFFKNIINTIKNFFRGIGDMT
ncbi:MAG: hypothetical protein IJC79_01505 [Clostridia bacterium]|nr:hypothetical protein [Clostridia bacterium]